MNKKNIFALISAAVAGMLCSGAALAKANPAETDEVINAMEPLKQQVEFCLFDQGFEAIENCSTGNKAQDFDSLGWDLSKDPKAYATRYVESVTVKNGVVTAKATNAGVLNGETFIFVPADASDRIKWNLDEKSTCLNAGIC